MSKYIDSEKLIAEIERRIEETKSMKPAFDQFWAGQISAFKGAIKIITSLQQEQPQIADASKMEEVELEKELENFAKQYPIEDSGSYRNLMTLARHFYELGRNTRKDD